MHTRDEILKMKAAMLYVINKVGSIDTLHLFKILYFADREHLVRYGRHIINDDFKAIEMGPIPSCIYSAIKVVQGKNKAEKYSHLEELFNCIEIGDRLHYVIKAKEKPDMDELSASDIKCLDDSFEENRLIDTYDLSQKSHDHAWNKARENGYSRNPSMNTLDIAYAGGASDAMLEYIKESEIIDSILR